MKSSLKKLIIKCLVVCSVLFLGVFAFGTAGSMSKANAAPKTKSVISTSFGKQSSGSSLVSLIKKTVKAVEKTVQKIVTVIAKELKKYEPVKPQPQPEPEPQKDPLSINYNALTSRAYDTYTLDYDQINFVACLVEDYVTELGYTVDDLNDSEREAMEKAIIAGIEQKRAEAAPEQPHDDTTEEETHEGEDSEEFDVEWEGCLAFNAGQNGTEYPFDKVPAEYLDEIKAKYEEGKELAISETEEHNDEVEVVVETNEDEGFNIESEKEFILYTVYNGYTYTAEGVPAEYVDELMAYYYEKYNEFMAEGND